MSVFAEIETNLVELKEVILHLGQESYKTTIGALQGASIGEHCRHIIELFEALMNGYESGIINYDKRARDKELETNIDKAILHLDIMIGKLNQPDKWLVIQSMVDQSTLVKSSYYRELLYNYEHSIHHAAIIKIGMHLLGTAQQPKNFGIAPSTIKYREQCAQ